MFSHYCISGTFLGIGGRTANKHTKPSPIEFVFYSKVNKASIKPWSPYPKHTSNAGTNSAVAR